MMQAKRISSYILKLTLISLLLLLPVVVSAQKHVDEILQPDTVPLFRGVVVSVDMVGLIQHEVSTYGQYEAACKINLKDKYFPVIEVGIGDANATDDVTNITYKTRAPYGKIGIDVNLLKNKHDDYRLYGGIRYAYTRFKYDVSSPVFADPVWGSDVTYEANGVACSYQWAELALSVDAKIWGPFRLGWSLRYRHKVTGNEGELGKAWYVPGYGKAGSTVMSGTFNVIIEL